MCEKSTATTCIWRCAKYNASRPVPEPRSRTAAPDMRRRSKASAAMLAEMLGSEPNRSGSFENTLSQWSCIAIRSRCSLGRSDRFAPLHRRAHHRARVRLLAHRVRRLRRARKVARLCVLLGHRGPTCFLCSGGRIAELAERWFVARSARIQTRHRGRWRRGQRAHHAGLGR